MLHLYYFQSLLEQHGICYGYKIGMNLQQYLKVVICVVSLTDLTSFLLSFMLWSFQVLGEVSMDYGIRSGKSLILGIPKAPQGKIQGQPKA